MKEVQNKNHTDEAKRLNEELDQNLKDLQPESKEAASPETGAAPCGFHSGTPRRRTACRDYRCNRDTGTGAALPGA